MLAACGAPPGEAHFTIERFGWEQVARRPGWRGWLDFAGERAWRVEGELRLKEGDRAVFFVARDPGPSNPGLTAGAASTGE